MGVIVCTMPPSEGVPPLLELLDPPEELDPEEDPTPLLLPLPLLPPLPLPPSPFCGDDVVSPLLPQAIGVRRNGAARRNGQAKLRCMGAHSLHCARGYST
jgi:hypothetical protein